jgi:hypothetical protein
MRPISAALVVVALIGACGDDDDGGGGGNGPARKGTSAQYVDAWTMEANARCAAAAGREAGVSSVEARCGVTFAADEDELSAAEAEASNFGVAYSPGADDAEATGWAVATEFAAATGCVLPADPPGDASLFDC